MSDAVVHTADCAHLESAQALVEGLKAGNNSSGVFLHTSGTIGIRNVGGGKTSPPTFDDADMGSVNSIPMDSPHRLVDNWILGNCQDIRAAIISPSAVSGLGTGFFNKTTLCQTALVKAGIDRKRAGYVGGEYPNHVFGNVNIHDLVDLYQLVLDGLLSNTIESGEEGGYYFGTTQDHSWYKVAQAVGSILHKLGKVESPDLSEFEDDYVDKYFGGAQFAELIWGGDSRCVANRSKRIGWKPSHPDIFETLEQEINYIIEKIKGQ